MFELVRVTFKEGNYQQVRRKLEQLGVSEFLKTYDRKVSELDRTVKKEVTTIYLASMKSAIPIRKAGLTAQNRLSIQKLLQQGLTPHEAALRVANNPGSPIHGGALRSSITSNIGAIKKNVDGIVYIPEGLHDVPYKKFGEIKTELIDLAKHLDIGVYTTNRKNPDGGDRIVKEDLYERSRNSANVNGFPSIAKGQPTKDWIDKGRRSAEPLVAAYVRSPAKTVAAYVDIQKQFAPEFRAPEVMQAASYLQGLSNIEFSVDTKALYKKALKYADNATPDEGTSASDLFGA